MYIIGIAGGTGSGKTTVVKKILETLPTDRVALIPQDSYYNDTSHLTPEERKRINFDHPTPSTGSFSPSRYRPCDRERASSSPPTAT